MIPGINKRESKASQNLSTPVMWRCFSNDKTISKLLNSILRNIWEEIQISNSRDLSLKRKVRINWTRIRISNPKKRTISLKNSENLAKKDKTNLLKTYKKTPFNLNTKVWTMICTREFFRSSKSLLKNSKASNQIWM